MGNRARVSASALALAAGLAAAAAAQEGTGETEVIVVRSAPILTEADSLVGSADVLSADEIVSRLNGNLGDTLASLPGVESTFFGPGAGRPVVRGLGAERVQVLINGLGLIDASSASPDHAVAADPLGAESIEVLRGPAAIAYGGGAVGGVINVFDGRIPEEPLDAPVEGEAYAGYTSVDEGSQLAARVRAGAGPVVFQLQGERREADEYEIPGFAESALQRAMEEKEHGEEEHDHEDEEEAFGVVENSDYEFETYGGAVSLVSERGFLGVSIKQIDAEYGLPGGHEHAHGEEEEEHEEGEEHEEEEEEIVRLVLEQTRYDIRGELNRDGFYNRVRGALAFADYEHVELEGDETGTTFSNEGYEGRLELAHRHDDARAGALGVQFADRDFAAVGDEAYVEPATATEFGVFAVERYDAGGWGIEGGVRYDTRKVDGTVDGVAFSRDFNAFSGSISGFLRPSEDVFLGLILSRTQRAPTDIELASNGAHIATRAVEIGDLDLDTETAWTLEGAARWTTDRAEASATVFANNYNGFIGLFDTGEIDEDEDLPIFNYRQTDAEFFGFELYGRTELFTAAAALISADAAIDFVEADSDLGELPRIPSLSATFGLEAERGALSGRFEIEHHAEQAEVAEFELPTESYTFLNASAQWRPLAERDVVLIAGVRNLADEEGRVHTSFLKDLIPLPGRNVRVAIRAAF